MQQASHRFVYSLIYSSTDALMIRASISEPSLAQTRPSAISSADSSGYVLLHLFRFLFVSSRYFGVKMIFKVLNTCATLPYNFPGPAGPGTRSDVSTSTRVGLAAACKRLPALHGDSPARRLPHVRFGSAELGIRVPDRAPDCKQTGSEHRFIRRRGTFLRFIS